MLESIAEVPTLKQHTPTLMAAVQHQLEVCLRRQAHSLFAMFASGSSIFLGHMRSRLAEAVYLCDLECKSWGFEFLATRPKGKG